MPSAHQYTSRERDRSRRFHASCSSAHCAFSRLTTLADSPRAASPSKTRSDSPLSPVERPFRYSQGRAADPRFDFRIYGGTMVALNVMPDPERLRTLGPVPAIGPAPVSTSRSGK